MINKRATLAAGDQPKAAKQGKDHLMYQPSVLALIFSKFELLRKGAQSCGAALLLSVRLFFLISATVSVGSAHRVRHIGRRNFKWHPVHRIASGTSQFPDF